MSHILPFQYNFFARFRILYLTNILYATLQVDSIEYVLSNNFICVCLAHSEDVNGKHSNGNIVISYDTRCTCNVVKFIASYSLSSYRENCVEHADIVFLWCSSSLPTYPEAILCKRCNCLHIIFVRSYFEWYGNTDMKLALFIPWLLTYKFLFSLYAMQTLYV